MEVVEPPYWEPTRIPVSMMMPKVASCESVKGSIRLIVVVGPKPGSTPITVPRIAPIRQARMYLKERKVANPLNKASNSMMTAPYLPGLCPKSIRQVDRQQVPEQKVGERGIGAGQEQRFHPAFHPA